MVKEVQLLHDLLGRSVGPYYLKKPPIFALIYAMNRLNCIWLVDHINSDFVAM